MGGLACAEEIAVPILTDKCQVIAASGGEQVIVQTHDTETAFSVPASKFEKLVRGLEHTHKAEMKYPTTPFLTFQGQLPSAFSELMDFLVTGD
jgi:uncharacterized protein (DUF169 family)